MPSLAKGLRGKLASITLAARTRAEAATRAALENLAVHERQARGPMDQAKKDLCTKLRARGKALGDGRADVPVSARKQMMELPDELATRVNIIFYADARDALLKAIAA
jgi:predicted ATP-dependent Lon-type protease